MGKCLSKYLNTAGCVSELILEHLTDVITIWDKNQKCIFANNAARDYFSSIEFIRQDSMVQNNFPSLSDLGEKWIKRANDVFASGSGSKFQEVEKINNSDFYSETTLFPIFDEFGQVVAVMLLLKNITEKSTFQKELALTIKLAELGKIFTYFSHEMKTPLNSIIMNVDILSENENLSGNNRKSIEIVRQELKRLNKMMHEVLIFSQSNTSVNSPVSLTSVLTNIYYLITPLLQEKNIVLTLNVKDFMVLGHENEMQSVFFELINNAIAAINENGSIDIFTVEDLPGSKIHVFVKDSGCGIKCPDQIFLPFYTTKQDGYGIGLAQIIKSLTKMDSSIRLVSSEPGCTIFELVFNLQGYNG